MRSLDNRGGKSTPRIIRAIRRNSRKCKLSRVKFHNVNLFACSGFGGCCSAFDIFSVTLIGLLPALWITIENDENFSLIKLVDHSYINKTTPKIIDFQTDAYSSKNLSILFYFTLLAGYISETLLLSFVYSDSANLIVPKAREPANSTRLEPLPLDSMYLFLFALFLFAYLFLSKERDNLRVTGTGASSSTNSQTGWKHATEILAKGR